MKTDVIRLTGDTNEYMRVLQEAMKFAAYKELPNKQALHLRLLTEELIGMMRSITGEKDGEFWIEDADSVCELHLKVHTIMNTRKREQLLGAATSGKNESAKGLMGRLRDVFDRAADEDLLAAGGALTRIAPFEPAGEFSMSWDWSMISYREELSKLVSLNDKEAGEMWDELEKSVVTHVADDIKVSIRGQNAEMIIIKKLA